MKSVSFSLIIGSISTLAILLIGVQAQNVPCTTPAKKSGLCVPIQRCLNIYGLITSPMPLSPGHANYIKKAACSLPNVERSVCCQPQEVVLRPSTATTSCSGGSAASKLKLLPRECGPQSADRISHGNETRVFDYPWMAVLRYETFNKITDGCGGSLINKRYVLTAAHCIKVKRNQKLHSVILGEHTKEQDEDCNIFLNERGVEIERDCADPIEEFGIESSTIHEEYNRPKYSNDIGLIRLDRDVAMKDHIKPICLPVTADLRRKTFDKYILTGWGTTEHNSPSNVLLQATLPLVDNQECQRKLTEKRLNIDLDSKQMCAGGKDRVDACGGDSGGPLGTFSSYQGNTRFVQYGIVATGINSCGHTSVPGVYSRVADYMDWILDKIC